LDNRGHQSRDYDNFEWIDTIFAAEMESSTIFTIIYPYLLGFLRLSIYAAPDSASDVRPFRRGGAPRNPRMRSLQLLYFSPCCYLLNTDLPAALPEEAAAVVLAPIRPAALLPRPAPRADPVLALPVEAQDRKAVLQAVRPEAAVRPLPPGRPEAKRGPSKAAELKTNPCRGVPPQARNTLKKAGSHGDGIRIS
jgi:hypothetical protein